ncbi:alanine racemase [Uliginosibacterium sp. H3]|uniref:Alanine racemase n=1 Tax=Uliginosibacterium silvisoli TaxID=3114758 RepID=A0ABU6K756_9RHOO|nr:alanine racemase [Uliginosibacterium sp. H3]
MARPIRARIDTAAFRHNYLLSKQHAPQSRAWCVVKANAYGHGLANCAEAVRDVVDGFALLDMAEAAWLRSEGFLQPVLLLEGGFDAAELHEAAKLNLAIVVHAMPQLDALEEAVLSQRLDVFLKINTGMNRLGFVPADVPKVLARLRACGNVRSLTLMTHFACADGLGIASQWACFTDCMAGSELPFSAANSAALLRFPETHGAWVRPGIMLYGGSPMPASQSAADLGVRPVMTLISELIGVQTLHAGEHVGYGATFTAEHEMRVGVVACGYADGYPRHAPTGTPILVDGVRTRTLGRVSMDMLAVDLTPVPNATIGSPVTLWGKGLPADEVATAAGTISYELFCALARRVLVTTTDNKNG